MSDPRTAPHPCPKCGKTLDAACSLHNPEARPTPGDVSICIYCAALLQFDEALAPQILTNEALDAMPGEFIAELLHAQSSLVVFKAQEKTQL